MDSILLNELINYIEKQADTANGHNYVQDDRGSYQKERYLKNVISETKELRKYGEDMIALENVLDNLYEVSFLVDAHMAELIRKIFQGYIPEWIENILNSGEK